MTYNTKYSIYIDGASWGNPGESGIGVIICQGENAIKNVSKYIGIATNNIAEYMALIFGLQEALMGNLKNVNINTDSELLYKQIKGEYKVKDETLKLLNCLAKHLISGFTTVEFTNIPREKNRGADKLAEKAIKERPVLLRKRKKNKASQDDQLLDFV